MTDFKYFEYDEKLPFRILPSIGGSGKSWHAWYVPSKQKVRRNKIVKIYGANL